MYIPAVHGRKEKELKLAKAIGISIACQPPKGGELAPQAAGSSVQEPCVVQLTLCLCGSLTDPASPTMKLGSSLGHVTSRGGGRGILKW